MNDFALQAFGGRNPMFGNQAEPKMALDFNLGMFGNNPLVALGGNAAMGAVMGNAGLMPAQFMATQNFYDQVMAKQHFVERQRAMSDAAQADRSTYVNVLRGVARMTGRPFGLQQEQAAQSLAGGIAAIAPFIAQVAPEIFDQFHGARGSATVMAQGIHRGGMFAQDAATGLTGLSGATAGGVAGEIQRRFFGPGADISAFRGLSMGRLGMLYEDIQARGLAGPSIAASGDPAQQIGAMASDSRFVAAQLQAIKGRDPGLRSRILDTLAPRVAGGPATDVDQERKVAETQHIARDALARIKQDSPDAFDDIKRNFDAKRIGDRLKNLSGAVSAMRDIFGDMGRPNAPMKELVEGLNQLTQGGLATTSPAQLERSVRMTQSLARTSGIGMDGMLGLMARGAGIADQIGVERPFAVQGTQGAVAFGAAFGQVGRGDVAHFQANDRETMTMLDQRLRMQAAKSGMANQLNTTLRMADTVDGLGGGAQALAAAIKAQKTTFRNPLTGKDESIFMDEGAWRNLMKSSGVAEPELNRMALQANTNRQFGAQYDTAALVRQSQADELKGFVAQAQRGSIVDAVRRQGIGGDRAERIALGAGNAAADTLMGMDAGDRRNDRRRDKLVADAIRNSLSAQGVDVTKISAQSLATMAGAGFGEFNEMVQRNPMLRAYRTGLTALEVNDPNTLRRQREITDENRITAAMRSAVSGIGQAGPLAKIMDAIQSPPDELRKFIGQALGGVDPAAVRGQLAGLRDMSPAALAAAGVTDKDRLAVMTEQFTKVVSGFEQAKKIADPGQRNAQLGALNADAEALMGDAAAANRQIEGALKGAGLGVGDLQAAIRGDKGGFDAAGRARLQALGLAAHKGIANAAADVGIAVGARFGAAQVGEILSAGGRLDRARRGLAGLAGDDLARAQKDAERHAGTLVEGIRTGVDTILADADQVKGLGAGGLGLAQGLRAKQLRLQALADKHADGDVAKLLASGNKNAIDLRGGITADLAEVARRQDAKPGALAVMDKAERDKVDAFHRDLTMPDDDKNRRAIARLLREAGGGKDRLTDEEQSQLAGELGAGKRGDVARAALERGLDARAALDKMAKDKGWDAGDFRAAVREGKGADFGWNLSRDEKARINNLAADAGSVLRAGRDDEGLSFKTFRDSLEDVKAKASAVKEGDDAGAKGVQRIVGTLEIKGNQGNLVARADAAGEGSTPVAHMPIA